MSTKEQRNDIYIEIIKKQQEIINLMLQAGLQTLASPEMEVTPVFEQPQTQKCDIEGFAEWLRKKGMSQNCIDTYTTTIKLFFQEYKVMTVETLGDYEQSLSKWKPKTINLRVAAMYKYFKFIGFEGYEFKRAKEQKKTFCDNAINEQQYEQLIAWAAEHNKKVWLICKVIACTGVRVSELINLKTADLEKGYADIVGKGKKQRRVYFPKTLVDEIRDICGSIYVVENSRNEQITTRGVSSLLERAGKLAGVPKEVMHPHSFRHFFAKQFLKKKNDITLLGDLLGHSNISTTAIYTRMTSEEQKKEIDDVFDRQERKCHE